MMIALIIFGVLFMVGGIATALSDYFENKKAKLTIGIAVSIIGFGLLLLGNALHDPELTLTYDPDTGKVEAECGKKRMSLLLKERESAKQDSSGKENVFQDSLNQCLPFFSPNAQSAYDSALIALANEQYVFARELFRHALDKEQLAPAERFDAFYFIGITFHVEQMYDSALTSYDTAITISRSYYRVWTNRGHCLLSLKLYEGCISSSDSALVRESNDYLAWMNKGYAYTALNKLDLAMRCFDNSISIYPDLCPALLGRGLVFRHANRLQDALASYDRAIECNPLFFEAWNNKGYAFNQAKQYEKAIESFNICLSIKPDHTPALFNRADAYFALAKYDLAERGYSAALALNADNALAWRYRAVCLVNLGRWEDANNSLMRAQAIQPLDVLDEDIEKAIRTRKGIGFKQSPTASS